MRSFAAALLLWLAVPAAAQFRVESRAVLADVSVSRDGANGGPVRGLGPDDFELRVAGEPTGFRLLDPASLPIAVLFAMDASPSTRGDRRRRLAAGARRFAEAMTGRDDCGVVAFASRARWAREFGPCGPEVGERLLAATAGGATALRDGLILSLAALHGANRRPVLLLFTDGQDNLSWARPEHVRRAVRASEALLYAIVAEPPRRAQAIRGDRSGPLLLEELAAATGGRVVPIRSDADLEGAFEEVLRDLRVRHVLAFTPEPGRAGFVPIEVRVRRRGVRVRTRAGYTARR